MGGRWSGRWGDYTPRETVERSLMLDANRLMRQGILQAGADSDGVLLCGSGGLRYLVTTGHDAGRLAIVYGVHGQIVAERIDLVSSRPPLGGLRWWFQCPQAGCARRVVKLHLPSGRTRFRCRVCHDLTYNSCQRSHSLDAICSRMAAEAGPGWTVSLMRRFVERHHGTKYGRKRRDRLIRDVIQAGLLASAPPRWPAPSSPDRCFAHPFPAEGIDDEAGLSSH